MSVKSSNTLPDVKDLEASINEIKGNQVTVGGKTAYAISPSKLASLERRVNRVLVSFDSTDNQANIALSLNKQLEEIKAQYKEVNMLKEASEAARATATRDLAKAQSALRAKEALYRDAQAENLTIKADLVRQMKEAQLLSGKLKIEAAKAKKGFEPDVALEAKAAHEAQAKVVNDLNDRIAQLNSHTRQQEKEIDLLKSNVQKMEAEKQMASASIVQIKNALAKGNEELTTPLKLSPRIEAILGKEACTILSNWHNLAFDDARERTYLMATAFTKSRNSLVKAVGNLLFRLFEWIKSNSKKVWSLALPFLALIASHIRAGGFKAVAFYKKELLKLKLEGLSLANKVYAKEQGFKPYKVNESEDLPFFDNIWFTGYALVLRIKRRTNSTFTRFVDFLSWVGSKFRADRKGKGPVSTSSKWREWFFWSSSKTYRKAYSSDDVIFESIDLKDNDTDELYSVFEDGPEPKPI